MVNSQLILDVLEDRFDYAQMLDYDFNMEDYEWILGREIICALERELDRYCGYDTEDDGMYIYDSTNLMVFRVKDYYHAILINGKGNFRLHPYFSYIDVNSSMQGQCIDKLFESGDYSCPYDRDKIITTSNANIELFKNNSALFSDFYDDARSDIVSISEITDRIKIRRKDKK